MRYPGIYLPLVGKDGNAFAILARAQKAMTRARLPKSEIDAYTKEATSGDYDHLLNTTMQWFNTEVPGADLMEEEDEDACLNCFYMDKEEGEDFCSNCLEGMES